MSEWDGKVEGYALTQASDTSEVAAVDLPRVEIAEDGRLKFIALKGATGATGSIGVQRPRGDIGSQGVKGETGNVAGFGEITASAVALEVGSNPQASVVASGDNAAKNKAVRNACTFLILPHLISAYLEGFGVFHKCQRIHNIKRF